ncbi:PREDICTED: suppressor of Mek1-like [Papilio polytes]|uniref:suppressor of Mek1-like n=1 Tax=Papilio polytes TaxID=76194 RepID=UPI000675D2D6|nr:PREDICTED: suppressor of Mek1-like [Papilio polytes]
MSNGNQNTTLDKPPQNATIIKSITNTTNDINEESNSTINQQIIEILDKDNQNVTEKPTGNDSQTVLKEQYIAESDLKQNHTNDTLMKYIYKKNEKVNLPEKSKGHDQNSLKRKKRFINSSDSDIVPRPQNLPVSIDYVDIDHAKVKEEIFLPATRTGGIVQSSNLADFNIETIHNDKTKSANDDTHKENINPKAQIITKFSPNLDETKEESQESVENHENKYRLEKRPQNKDSGENRSQSEEISSSIESEHSVELPNTSTSIEYIGESKETEMYRDSINPIPPKKPQNEKNQESDKAYESSIENSSETNHEYTGTIESSELHSNQGNNSNSDNSPLIVPKQDYVNHEINKDNVDGFPLLSRENYTKDVGTDSLETPKLSEKVSDESKSDENTEIYTDSRSVEELKDTKSEKQTRINDDEVKPVVELNNGSIESSEEISDEDVNLYLKNNSKLVSLTPVKNVDTKKKDASAQSDNSEKVDVKQQFERIPLDYNHANEEIKNNSSNTTASQIKPTAISSEEKDKEGTLDTLTPLNPTYDDELNVKFHNVPIKLPEIKLPEDILSYAYDGPYYETKTRKDKDAQKQKFYYNYEDDDTENVKKEAEKSGDPNANYMWTLEYGENL